MQRTPFALTMTSTAGLECYPLSRIYRYIVYCWSLITRLSSLINTSLLILYDFFFCQNDTHAPPFLFGVILPLRVVSYFEFFFLGFSFGNHSGRGTLGIDFPKRVCDQQVLEVKNTTHHTCTLPRAAHSSSHHITYILSLIIITPPLYKPYVQHLN